MKYYKTVILRSTSGNKINIPKDIWKKMGWKLNDKVRLSYAFDAPSEDANPISLTIDKVDY